MSVVCKLVDQEDGVIQSENEGLRIGADGLSLGLNTEDQELNALENEGR